MKLKLHNERLREQLSVITPPFIKFVTYIENGEHILSIADPEYTRHIDMFPHDAELIGGGEFDTRSNKTEWGSYTLQKAYSQDRPSDKLEAAMIIFDIRQVITHWLNNHQNHESK